MCQHSHLADKVKSTPGVNRLSLILGGLVADAALLAYGLGFLFFRIGELIPLFFHYPHQSLTTIIVFAATTIRFSLLPGGASSRRLLTVVSFIALYYILDVLLNLSPPTADDVAAGTARLVGTAVVTGANSGVGYETARALVLSYGTTVIMACRSEVRCAAAARRINDEASADAGGTGKKGRAVPMMLDLGSFDSVRSFVHDLWSPDDSMVVDTLFNNAGYAPYADVPVNEVGLEASFASMHLSHHLLTEMLLKDYPELRVVNTSSATHHACALPFAYFSRSVVDWMVETNQLSHRAGCVEEEFLTGGGMTSPTGKGAYFVAKMANVLHVSEIPRRKDRIATAVAVDLGWVGTGIQPFMTGSLTPTSLGWMRSAEVGVTPVLNAMLRTDEELLVMVEANGNNAGGKLPRRTWTEGGGVVINALGKPVEPFSYPWWTEHGRSGEDVGSGRMRNLAEKLWEISEAQTVGRLQ